MYASRAHEKLKYNWRESKVKNWYTHTHAHSECLKISKTVEKKSISLMKPDPFIIHLCGL